MSYLINSVKHISPPHKHNNYEIIVVLDGKGCFHVPEKAFPAAPGSILIIPPGTVHCASADEDLERIYVNGDFNQIFNLDSPIMLWDDAEGDGTALAKMIYNNRYENADYVAALCNAFTHFLLQNIKMDDNIGLAVTEIVREITENFHDSNISLSYLLNKSGYAEDYIRAHFKRITGKTPNAFLTDIRMKHARYLIDIYKNSLSLAQIAEKCGYTDYVYFSRKFKLTIGISPQEYKNSL